MDGSTLLSIAQDWSFWDALPPETVPRQVSLPHEWRSEIALVVQGVRRGGKSTLLAQLIDGYRLDRQRCLFLNFEDPRLGQDLDHTTLDVMVEAFEANHRGEPCSYFLDEIQWVNGWQRWLRRHLDRPQGRRFIVTGSNAHLLSGELGSTLTGRHHTIELFPFDFDEFRTARPGASLDEYLECGGFPAAVFSADRDRLLRGYFHDIVERDMRERVGARSTLPLRRLVQMLFESTGSETSARRLAASLGLSVDTVLLYMDAAESAYLAFGCPYFAFSARKQVVRNRKCYPIDSGLRRVNVTPTGVDRGKQFECAVYVLLRRRFHDVFYWRGRGEIDFVVECNGTPVPVQVTSLDEPQERHLRAIDEFHAVHPTAAEGVIVTPESYQRGVPELAGHNRQTD